MTRRRLVLSAVAVVAAMYAAVGYQWVSRASAADKWLPLIEQATSSRYDPDGAFPWPVRSTVNPPSLVLREGLPVVLYEQGYRRNPVSIAQWGLWSLREGRSRPAVRAAEWLISHQRPDGRWLYGFDFRTSGTTIKAPWGSALAQAQAMSLFTRLYRQTGDRRYLAAARRAFRPIVTPVSQGGMMRCFRRDCRYPFYEEYPAPQPTYVLNGFMATLVGLYDLGRHDAAAAAAYAAGRRTLQHALPLYTVNGRSVYHLAYLRGGPKDYNPPSYLSVEITLLRTLDSIAPAAALEGAAAMRLRELGAA